MAIVDMLDTITGDAGNIPVNTPKVGGYTTGSGIKWTIAEWDRFRYSGKVLIDQSYGAIAPLTSNVIDVETGTATAAQAAQWVKTRISAGIQWSTIYANDGYLASCITALKAIGSTWYYGHVNCWFANWNLTRSQAAAIIGTQIRGITCVAVQYASPESNPSTMVPRGTQTLAQSNIDLSVALDSWFPAITVPYSFTASATANGNPSSATASFSVTV